MQLQHLTKLPFLMIFVRLAYTLILNSYVSIQVVLAQHLSENCKGIARNLYFKTASLKSFNYHWNF